MNIYDSFIYEGEEKMHYVPKSLKKLISILSEVLEESDDEGEEQTWN